MRILTFINTHDAIAAERLLKPEMPIELMPTPTWISAGCGIAIRIADEHLSRAESLLNASGRPFQVNNEEKQKTCVQL